MAKFEIKSVELQTRVTSLAFYEHWVLLGEGNLLSIYDTREKKLLKRYPIFNGSASIHGITISQKIKNSCDLTKACLRAGKSFAIVQFRFEKPILEILSKETLQEWIWDSKWLTKEGSEECLAMALAHNAILLWDVRKRVPLKQVRFSEPSLLYCGCLIGENWSSLVLAAGTVYQEVVLWSPSDRNGKLLHRLTGHEGVIFCIKFDSKLNVLCSTSDDRSIRVWKFSHSNLKSKDYKDDFNYTLEDWQNGAFSLAYTLFAHQARVWRVSILKTGYVSVGEDSLITFWTQDGQLIKSEKISKSGLLSLAVNDDETLAAVGSEDGSLTLLGINGNTIQFRMKETLLRLTEENDFPRSIAIRKIGTEFYDVVISTNSGFLLSCDCKSSSWKILLKSHRALKSYSIISVSSLTSMVAIATLSGSLIFVDLQGNISDLIRAHSGKVHSLFWSNTRDDQLLTSGPDGLVILWQLLTGEAEKTIISLCTLSKFKLPDCKQRWLSSSYHTIKESNDDSFFSILGDRMGGIHLYKFWENEKEAIRNPIQSLPAFHGKNGVTDIQKRNGMILTSGRDGNMAYFTLCKSTDTLQLLYTYKVPGNKLEWIARIIDDEKSEMFLAGFHSSQFILWDFSSQRKLLELDCGGGHRAWDFYSAPQPTAGSSNNLFVCVRKQALSIWTATTMENDGAAETSIFATLKEPFHNSKIWCAKLLFSVPEKNLWYIASAGEENRIIISKIQNNSDEKSSPLTVEHCLFMSGHISIIRALSHTPLDQNGRRSLLISAGGQSQFIIWEISLQETTTTGGIAYRFLCSHFLQNDFSSKKKPETGNEPRVRFMDAVIFKDNFSVNCYGIILASSDGQLRTFRYSHRHQGEQEKKEGNSICKRKKHEIEFLYSLMASPYSCFLKMKFLNSNENLTDIFFLTGDNGGKIAFWKSSATSNDLRPENQENQINLLKGHQGGVNALAVHHLKNDSWLICSGGDDNCLLVQIVDVKTKTKRKENNVKICAHAAQITGVCVIEKSDSKGLILSASVDQRITIWEWSLLPETNIEVAFKETKMSCVPDIADFLLLEDKENSTISAIVFGHGLEIFTIQETTN